MANKSILAAFERMWQHVAAAIGKVNENLLTLDTAPELEADGTLCFQPGIENQTYEIVDKNALHFNEEQKLTETQQKQARTNLGLDLFAYNFKHISADSTTYSEFPEDARALKYIDENWEKMPLSIYVKGYPVIAIDRAKARLVVLYNNNQLYFFDYKYTADLKKIIFHQSLHGILADTNYVANNAVSHTKIQELSDDAKTRARSNIGAVSATEVEQMIANALASKTNGGE